MIKACTYASLKLAEVESREKFRQKIRDLLRKQIKEGEKLLEGFEEPSKEDDQMTVGIGWYQWGDHAPAEEDEYKGD